MTFIFIECLKVTILYFINRIMIKICDHSNVFSRIPIRSHVYRLPHFCLRRYKSYRAYPVNIDLTADDTRHFQLGMRCTVAANMQDKRRGYISTHARVGNNSLLYKEPVMAVEM